MLRKLGVFRKFGMFGGSLSSVLLRHSDNVTEPR
jgi:hypothetical protein